MAAKINYNNENGTDLVVYPDDIDYNVIQEPFIIVDNETALDVINNRMTRKVDLNTLEIVVCEEPIVNPTKQSKILKCKSDWDTQQRVFKDRMLGAMCFDGATMDAAIKSIQTDWATANTEYKNKLKEIANNG